MRRLLLLAATASVLVGCGESQAACAPVRREPLDPASGVHLLPGAEEPDYVSDPPTSGPHLAGRPPTGVQTEPLDLATQVLLLESGGVLIQYGDVDPEEVDEIESLAGDRVVVAPGRDLPEPVVATAWLTKQSCAEVDVDTLRDFVDEHRGVSAHEARSSGTAAGPSVS